MSRKIAFTGIFTGIAFLFLYMSMIMPAGKLTLFFLASLPVAVAIIEYGAGAGAAVYTATCILFALIAGNILGVVPFALFFGHYPIFKFYIEKGRSSAWEVLLKLAVFNTSMLLWYFLFKSLFITVLPVQLEGNGLMLSAFILIIQAVFFIYDFVFSRLLFYYETKFGPVKRQ